MVSERVLTKGVEIQGGKGFRVERRSDRENRACPFGKRRFKMVRKIAH